MRPDVEGFHVVVENAVDVKRPWLLREAVAGLYVRHVEIGGNLGFMKCLLVKLRLKFKEIFAMSSVYICIVLM